MSTLQKWLLGISGTGFFLSLLNILTLQNPLLGSIGFLLYAAGLSLWIGGMFKTTNLIQRFAFGFLTLLCTLLLLNTASYYLFAVTPVTTFALFFVQFGWFVFPKKYICEFSLPKTHVSFSSATLFSLIFILGEIFLFFILFQHRTTELAPSPWHLLPTWFFGVYAAITGILFFRTYKKQDTTALFLSSFHLFFTFSIAAILYPLGYGYDAFIHRATEEWIVQHGYILPKAPYYIGQYSLLAALHHFTQLKIFLLDVFFVPVLASLFLPSFLSWTTEQASKITSRISLFSVWIIPFVPFLSLHLTTPHNVVLLFSLLTIFLLYAYSEQKISFFLPLLVSLSALFTHVLLGLPLTILTLAFFFLCTLKIEKKNWKKPTFLLTLFSFLTFIFPLLFTWSNLRLGGSFPHLLNPLHHFSEFLSLMKDPYWYKSPAPLFWQLLYVWEKLLTVLVLVLSLYGLFLQTKKWRIIIITSVTALVLDAWLLTSWIRFADVIEYEQGDYPLRILKFCVIVLLPSALVGFSSLITKISYKKMLLIPAVGLLTVSFYFSYPQRNAKVHFPGLNITTADFEAVKNIHEKHNEYNYIVISNQLVSAAALTEYSFAKYFDTSAGPLFYYAIPTGGKLYETYTKMIYQGQKREYMEEAMRLTGVKKSYFVLNSYWDNFPKIFENVKKNADSYYSLTNDKIWIFEYALK